MQFRKTNLLLMISGILFITTVLLVSSLVSPKEYRSRAQVVTNYFVSPSGNDSNNGTSAGTPLLTIQKAVDLAQAGSTITLAPGSYLQDVISKRDGTASAPITLTGPASATIKGGGNARIIEIQHDYIILTGFTVDGLFGSSNSESGYRDKLIYVQGKETRAGVKNLKILNMTLKNAGGECVRLRYFAEDNEIAHNIITNCGVYDFTFSGGGKNGEGVYIGTAPEQRGDGKNPTTDPDISKNNRVHHNVFDTQGNECVDIKESATANIIEFNSCTGQKDPNSAGFDSRGSGNIFRSNESYGNVGAGIRFGGDTAADGLQNDAYLNTIKDNQAGGIKFMRSPQGNICGNTMSNNTGGNAVGDFGSQFNPTAPCTGITNAPTITGDPTATSFPTASPTVSPTGQSGTRLSFNLGLHGIGKGGDNVNPNGFSTTAPLRPVRNITVQLYNVQNQLTGTPTGTVTFSATSGLFSGTIDVGSTVSTGIYTVKVRSQNYLTKTLPGVLSITAGQTLSVPRMNLVAGDSTDDNQLSILDYNMILDCFSELSPPRSCGTNEKKQSTDLTDDGNVNQFDYNLFLRELSVQSGE